QLITAQRAQIHVLRGVARADRTALARRDLFEGDPRRRLAIVKKLALFAHLGDRALDVAGRDVLAAAQPRIKILKNPARAFRLFGLAFQHDMIAIGAGQHAEAPLKQGEMLVVKAKQAAREMIVIEGEHDLGVFVDPCGFRRWRGAYVRSRQKLAPYAARAEADAAAPSKELPVRAEMRTCRNSPMRSRGPSIWTGWR